MDKIRLTVEQIAAIERYTSRGDRVEVIPQPNGVAKLLHVKREIIKTGQEKDCPKC